jgi:metal-responsive CopG/Arc/MetJ family transcriptional regulator
MKTAISLPDPLFRSADNMARRMRFSRSRLYATALREFFQRHRLDHVREKLDQVYGREESSLDPGLRRLQTKSLRKNAW